MTEVYLHQYDLTNGMARALSMQFIGRQVDAVWHTSIVAFGREHYFGQGISVAPPGATQFGQPHVRLLLGTTQLSLSLFTEFLNQLRQGRFTTTSYHILENNCNHFSDAAAQFLVGRGIPEDILALPRIALESPLGPLLSGMLSSVTNRAEPAMPDGVPVEDAIPSTAADDDDAFATAVKTEFDALMATGSHTADSASEVAVARALERGL